MSARVKLGDACGTWPEGVVAACRIFWRISDWAKSLPESPSNCWESSLARGAVVSVRSVFRETLARTLAGVNFFRESMPSSFQARATRSWLSDVIGPAS